MIPSQPCPSFPCFLWEKGKENHPKNKDCLSLPNPPNPWKARETAQKRKEILAGKKNKEFKNYKERKDREQEKIHAPDQ